MRIEKLNTPIQQQLAIKNLMAAVRRNAVNKTKSQRSKANFAAAEKLVKKAVFETSKLSLDISIQDISIHTILRRFLWQNPLTAEIIEREPEDFVKHTRYLVFNQWRAGKIIQEVEKRLKSGEKIQESKLGWAAYRKLYDINEEEAESFRLHGRLLPKELDFSLYQTLIKAFPKFGLVREGFRALDWSTQEMGIRNVRYRAFFYNPGLKEEVEAAEKILGEANHKAPDQAELRRLNHLRIKIKHLIITRNLDAWRLGAAHRQEYFKSIPDMAEQCFPFIKHPIFDRFADEFDCTNSEDLKKVYMHMRSRLKGKEKKQDNFAAFENHRFIGPAGTMFSFEEVLSKFEKVFYEKWAIGRLYQERGRKLSRKDLFDYLLSLVVYKDETQKQVKKNIHDIPSLNCLNEDFLIVNKIWIKEYKERLFPGQFHKLSYIFYPAFFQDLFGITLQEHLLSELKRTLAQELHGIKKIIGHINKDIVELNKRNSSLIKKYGMGIFEDLTGMSFEKYIRSEDFWSER